MRMKFKETRLTDGSMVFDVNIFANGTDSQTGEPKVIFSCTDERSARLFFETIERAVKEFTLEGIEVI